MPWYAFPVMENIGGDGKKTEQAPKPEEDLGFTVRKVLLSEAIKKFKRHQK